MKHWVCLWLGLWSMCLWAQDIEHNWNKIKTVQKVSLPAIEQAMHYQGSLSFSGLPEGEIELWWQDENHRHERLLKTQQREVAIYWTMPPQAKSLYLKSSKPQAIDACLSLKAYPIKAFEQACENDEPQSMVLQQLHQKLQQAQTHQRVGILKDFAQLLSEQGTPMVEHLNAHTMRLIYVWLGANNNVRLIGGPSNDHDWLQRLPNSGVWYKEYVVNRQYEGSYVFAVDTPRLQDASDGCIRQQTPESRVQRLAILGHLQLDPYNPHRLMGNHDGFQRNENVFSLRQKPNHTHAALQSVPSQIFHSQILNNERRISWYVPKGIGSEQTLPTLVFLDGEHYTETLNIPQQLDAWIASGRIQPVQAVFIHNPSAKARHQELLPNEAYVKMMQTELLPWLNQQSLWLDPKQTAIVGSSYGGLAAANLGLQLPQYFSHVISLSGSFWWQQNQEQNTLFLLQQIENQKSLPSLQWFLSANTYETARDGQGILESNQAVAMSLHNKGQAVHFKQYEGGHSYWVWQQALEEAVVMFFAQSFK